MIVNWKKNGVLQTPVSYTSLLDTLGGTGSQTATILLGTHVFSSGVSLNIEAWTSLPNGVADTIMRNDSSSLTLLPSLNGNYTIDASAPATGNNYQTWSAALADLNAAGVCGPIIFNVAAGTYIGQIEIGNIAGVFCN